MSDYSISPKEKAAYWEKIVEAAKEVIARGGAGIKFVPPQEGPGRIYRKHKQREKWLKEMTSKR